MQEGGETVSPGLMRPALSSCISPALGGMGGGRGETDYYLSFFKSGGSTHV